MEGFCREMQTTVWRVYKSNLVLNGASLLDATARREIELSHGGVGFFAGPLHGGARRDSMGKAVRKLVLSLLDHHRFFYPLVSKKTLSANRPRISLPNDKRKKGS